VGKMGYQIGEKEKKIKKKHTKENLVLNQKPTT
jgi:hypothetical protein